MEDINKRIIRNCIDVGFNITDIKQSKIKDKDDNNNFYQKTISYMNTLNRTKKGLILLIHKRSIHVARVIDYIENHLGYNDTNIILNAAKIARVYEDDRSNIAKAIKELVELDIIRKISDYIPNSILPKSTYAVNFNYICNGNIHEIRKELLNQRNNIKVENDGSKSKEIS